MEYDLRERPPRRLKACSSIHCDNVNLRGENGREKCTKCGNVLFALEEVDLTVINNYARYRNQRPKRLRLCDTCSFGLIPEQKPLRSWKGDADAGHFGLPRQKCLGCHRFLTEYWSILGITRTNDTPQDLVLQVRVCPKCPLYRSWPATSWGKAIVFDKARECRECCEPAITLTQLTPEIRALYKGNSWAQPRRIKICLSCPTPECSAVRSWTRDRGSEAAFADDSAWDYCNVGGACGREWMEFWCLEDKRPVCADVTLNQTASMHGITTDDPSSWDDELGVDLRLSTYPLQRDDSRAQIKVCLRCPEGVTWPFVSWLGNTTFFENLVGQCKKCASDLILMQEVDIPDRQKAVAQKVWKLPRRAKVCKSCPSGHFGTLYSWKGKMRGTAFEEEYEWQYCRTGSDRRVGKCNGHIASFWEIAHNTSASKEIGESDSVEVIVRLASVAHKRIRDNHKEDEHLPRSKVPRLAVMTTNTDIMRSTFGEDETALKTDAMNNRTFTSKLSSLEVVRPFPVRTSSGDIFTERNARIWNNMSPSSSAGSASTAKNAVESLCTVEDEMLAANFPHSGFTVDDENKENLIGQNPDHKLVCSKENTISCSKLVTHASASAKTSDPRKRRLQSLAEPAGSKGQSTIDVKGEVKKQIIVSKMKEQSVSDMSKQEKPNLCRLQELLRKVEQHGDVLTGDDLSEVESLYRQHGKNAQEKHHRRFSSEEIQCLVDEMKQQEDHSSRAAPSSQPPPPPPPPPLQDESEDEDQARYNVDTGEQNPPHQKTNSRQPHVPNRELIDQTHVEQVLNTTFKMNTCEATPVAHVLSSNNAVESHQSRVSPHLSRHLHQSSPATSSNATAPQTMTGSESNVAQRLPDWVRDDEHDPNLYWNVFGLPRFRPEWLCKFGV